MAAARPCKELHGYIFRTEMCSNISVSCALIGSHGLGKRALDLFEEMLQEGFRPDQATFSAVLCACCHSGLLKEGWTLFRRMKEDYSIVAQVEHYLYMVKLLANDGQLKEAYDLIQTIPICPDPGVLGAFLWGCSYNGYSDLGEAIAHRLFKLDPGKTAYRVILSNMYAAAKKVGDAILMRDDILRKGLQKTPGFSWI
ncbi:hypothetical protein HPP92_008193 [Vanilla planifolia]|uniref:Pentatricopeptide repeat-containing protein n=1 Tax=Vanilla planifolia TaxID=51239 RepID=A0A835V8I0_VANPL|nr:hypothetical protein HPP92_008193 [Vanilla planifolia]